MHITAFYPSIVLFSLVAASAHSTDVKDTLTITTSKLDIHLHGPFEALNIGCPTDDYNHFSPSNTQIAPLQAGWHTMGIGGTVILLVSVIWPVWKYLGNTVQNGRLVHRAGRSDAVSGSTPGEASLPQLGNDSITSHSRRRRTAAVASAEGVPNYDSPLRRAAHPLSSPSEPPEELSNHAVANSQRPPHVHTFQRIVVAGRQNPRLRTRSWPPINRSESPVVCLLTRPPDPYSLRRSLHKGARDLDDNHQRSDRYMLVVVGVDTLDHEDAENDAKYLQQMFESTTHGSVPHYKCVFGPNITRIDIRQAVLTLLDEARALPTPPQILMFFTGTGDQNNAMCLPNDETLSESDLHQWLSPPVEQIHEPAVGLLFDICRQAKSRLADIVRCVNMAWSCSVGELAYAIRLSKQEDKLFPRSIFLLAIFLAAHHTNIHSQDDHFFEVAFLSHIKQLSELILFAYNRGHQDRCAHCPPHKRCDPPVAQKPDLKHAGRAVTNLGMLIATHFPQHAREVFTEVDLRMKEGGFPRRLCPLFDPHVVQTIKSSPGGDGSHLDARTGSRAKARYANVQARHSTQIHSFPA